MVNIPKFFKDEESDSSKLLLPLLPLRDIVVFPHMVAPLFVGREKSVNALSDAMNKDKNIFLATQNKAGIDNPKTAFDVVEVSDLYAYQQPMWLEGLGVCDAGTGGLTVSTTAAGRPAVNPSGGTLAGNPMILGGLVRTAEASLQLMGKADGHQVDNAATALAHGVMGPAGQFHSVVTLSRD